MLPSEIELAAEGRLGEIIHCVNQVSPVIFIPLLFRTVDLAATEEFAEEAPDDIILVSESGIKTPADAQRLAAAGADALLIGETLMRSQNLLADLPAFMSLMPL